MFQVYSGFKNELLTLGGYSNDVKMRIYSSNDPISNAYFIGQSNKTLYINTLCNLPASIGIGTQIPLANLHLIGSAIISSQLTLGSSLITQNNTINAGSGALTVGTINTQGSAINAGTATITAATFSGNATGLSGAPNITVGTITTQNNNINAGSGTITGATFTGNASGLKIGRAHV